MTDAGQMLTVRVPWAVRKQRGGRKLVPPPGSSSNQGTAGAEDTLLKALARAFPWRRMMETGRFGTIDELAAAEKFNWSCISRLLRMTLLAPEIVEAVQDGRQSSRAAVPGLIESLPVK